jgi:signal transduction histidine kinase
MRSRALDLVRPLAAPRDLRLDLPDETADDAWVLADRQRLQQVLLNLLANAVKYNREGGAVTLSWEENPSERLQITVRDTGPGIAPEDLERLFVPFERLRAERTEVEGTGLGLSLSKRLIGAMGGEIGVESTVGTGSTFWVKLPRSSSPLARFQETGIPREPIATVQQGTVLYIEDNLATSR